MWNIGRYSAAAGEAVDIVLECFRFGKQFAELNRRISGECVTWQKKLLGLEFWNKAVGLDFDISIAELDIDNPGLAILLIL